MNVNYTELGRPCVWSVHSRLNRWQWSGWGNISHIITSESQHQRTQGVGQNQSSEEAGEQREQKKKIE